MRKNFFRLGIFFFPLLCLVMIFNYRMDPAELFHSSGAQAARLMLTGKSVASASGNFNEREKMDYLIKNMDAVEYVVMGPSLSITIDKDMARTESFANLSISSMRLEELLRAVAIMKQYDVLPKKMLICFDMSWFTLPVETEHFSELLDMDQLNVFYGSSTSGIFNHWKELFSLTYFQDSISYCLQNGIPEAGKVFVPPADYTGAYWKADGTHVYAEAARSQTVEGAKQRASEYSFPEACEHPLNEHNVVLLEECLSYLQQQGVAIKIMQVPYHPVLWERVQQVDDEREKVRQFDADVRSLAERLGIPVVGGQFYETLPGCSEEDFLDGRHMRAESIRTLFDLRIEG